MPEGDAGEGLPTAVDLGDGTLLLRDHGEIRLSANRQRWWNGRAWSLVADSTPSNARFDASGQRWWDGTEWRPRSATLPPWERRPALAVLGGTWLLWIVLMIVGVLSGLLGMLLIVVVSLPGISLVARSKILRSAEKTAYMLSLPGLAVLGLRAWRAGRRGPAATDGSAHLLA